MSKSIWNGVYASWTDAPQSDDVFDGPLWLDRITDTAIQMRAEYESTGLLKPVKIGLDYALPVVAGMAMPVDRPLTVIDYGGGLAASYFSLVAAVSGAVNFYVIETEEVCRRGRELFGDIDGLSFQSQFPQPDTPVDIIHAGSSLQYVEDYPEMLEHFSKFRPTYLLLADVLAGNIDTFVSTQNYYGKTIRVRFLNLEELLSEANRAGFRPIYKSLFSAAIHGKVDRLPMDNFRDGYKLDFPCQLLFRWHAV